MAIAPERTGNLYTVLEDAPSAEEALFGVPIFLRPPDGLGIVALQCIKGHPEKPNSFKFDDTGDTSIIELCEATTVVLPARVDSETGKLEVAGSQIGVKKVISGVYAGSNSEFSLR